MKKIVLHNTSMIEKKEIEERSINLAHYIIESKDTVRGAARKFGISKSTVHKDVTERLEKINPMLAKEVREILDENKANICLTHSYLNNDVYCTAGGIPRDIPFRTEFIKNHKYTIYEKIIKVLQFFIINITI